MRALGVLLILMLTAPQVSAHLPPGYKLRVATQVGEYELRVVLVPAKPVVNQSFEVVVGAVNARTKEPFAGVVLINGTPARRFSMAFYEVNLSIGETGRYTVPVELVDGHKRLGLNLSFEVVEQSAGARLLLPAIILLVLTAVLGAVGLLRGRR